MISLLAKVFSKRAKPQQELNAKLGAYHGSGLDAFFKLPLTRREFITDDKGDLWCIEIRKCSQTGSVLKGKYRV